MLQLFFPELMYCIKYLSNGVKRLAIFEMLIVKRHEVFYEISLNKCPEYFIQL